MVYIACRNSTSPLGVTFRVGMRLPAPFTATGKAILSAWSDDRVRTLMTNRWPEPLTANSVRHVDALLVELGETRARGFSMTTVKSERVCGALAFLFVMRPTKSPRASRSVYWLRVLTSPQSNWSPKTSGRLPRFFHFVWALTSAA